MTKDATRTTMALDVNSDHVGQLTLLNNSLKLSSTYCFIFIIPIFFFARAPGFEPRSTVLETAILPLNYARKQVSKVRHFLEMSHLTVPLIYINYLMISVT